MGYQEEVKTMNHAWKAENWLPEKTNQRRIFHDGQFQGWEYVRDDGIKGLEIFNCFLENYRVGQYLLSLSSVEMARSFVAGIQKWIDENEGKNAIKESWKLDVDRIASNRSWSELRAHFSKHLGEMERLDKNEKERAINKAFSLINLCAIAIRKMGTNLDPDEMNYKNMKERIDVHEKWLQEQEMKRKEQEKKDRETLKKRTWIVDDDTD